jgi:hypothetical protein
VYVIEITQIRQPTHSPTHRILASYQADSGMFAFTISPQSMDAGVFSFALGNSTELAHALDTALGHTHVAHKGLAAKTQPAAAAQPQRLSQTPATATRATSVRGPQPMAAMTGSRCGAPSTPGLSASGAGASRGGVQRGGAGASLQARPSGSATPGFTGGAGFAGGSGGGSLRAPQPKPMHMQKQAQAQAIVDDDDDDNDEDGYYKMNEEDEDYEPAEQFAPTRTL